MRREGEGWTFYKGGYPCRARGLGPAAVARGLGDRPLSPPPTGDRFFFISRDLIANLKKKFHIRPVALWGGDRGVFLKYLKTDIYF